MTEMNVLLIFNPEADDRIEGGRFDCECFALVSAAERDGMTTTEAGPQVVDRLRKAVTGGRHEGLRVWVFVQDRWFDVTDPSAEVLLALRGCLLHETEVVHDWFGEAAR